ncbi:hypothetical protein B6U99_07010 [Candidatus Geothermarchaeota archaeon ex4572_27]|nr:MAG: hypothetical protein B6U99_07010 [Candidatus Geothermarchaeota archaeon ex4572_27]
MSGEERRAPTVRLKGEALEVEDPDEARQLHSSGHYGEPVDGRLRLSPVEALHLLERGRVRVVDEGGRELSFEELARRLTRRDPKTWLKYLVYSDLRRRGYVVKGGLR